LAQVASLFPFTSTRHGETMRARPPRAEPPVPRQRRRGRGAGSGGPYCWSRESDGELL